MKRIVSKRTGRTEIVSNEIWEGMKKIGLAERFTASDVEPIKITPPKIIKPNKDDTRRKENS